MIAGDTAEVLPQPFDGRSHLPLLQTSYHPGVSNMVGWKIPEVNSMGISGS